MWLTQHDRWKVVMEDSLFPFDSQLIVIIAKRSESIGTNESDLSPASDSANYID